MADPATPAASHPDDAAPTPAAGHRSRRARRRDREERPQGAWGKIRETLLVILYAVIIAFLVKTFLLRGFYIPSGSMENTLELNDRIFVNVADSWFHDPSRGDIIVFEDTQGWIPASQQGQVSPARKALSFVGVMPDASENYLIKRVIGTGGDHVVCKDADSEVTVNGRTLDESSYLYPGSHPCGMPFDVTVPDGEFFVMGDHRDASADSRYHIEQKTEFVKADDVVGRAFVTAWPLNRSHLLDDHHEVFADVPAPSKS